MQRHNHISCDPCFLNNKSECVSNCICHKRSKLAFLSLFYKLEQNETNIVMNVFACQCILIVVCINVYL